MLKMKSDNVRVAEIVPSGTSSYFTPLQIRVRQKWPQEAFIAADHAGISVARTQFDLTQIGRLRYEVSMEREKNQHLDVDSDDRVFLESIDPLSLNLMACLNNRCLAAIRMTWAADAYRDPILSRILEHSRLKASDISNTILNSQFVIYESSIARSMAMHLQAHVNKIGKKIGARFCLMAASPSARGLFERLGLVCEEEALFDPAAGEMHIYKLDLHNQRHLSLFHASHKPDPRSVYINPIAASAL